MENGYFSIGRHEGEFKRIKHPKLFDYVSYDEKGVFWVIRFHIVMKR